MLQHMQDPDLFKRRISQLKNGKSPGPDSIPNGLLKHLPEGLHQAMHKMWMSGSTPKAWKESRTVLLYKKGSEYELNNWRPIALANTIYKLWTGMIAECIGKYADHYDILSSSQEGFSKDSVTTSLARIEPRTLTVRGQQLKPVRCKSPS